MEQTLTTSEVAKRFGIDTSTVRRWVSEGRLTPSKRSPKANGRTFAHLFSRSAVDRFKPPARGPKLPQAQPGELTTAQVAWLAGCDTSTVLSWVAQGILQQSRSVGTAKKARARFFKKEIVENFLSARLAKRL